MNRAMTLSEAVAWLMAQNDSLATENAHLRGQLAQSEADAAQYRNERDTLYTALIEQNKSVDELISATNEFFDSLQAPKPKAKIKGVN